MSARTLDAETFVRALASGLEAVKKRGDAAPAEKTVSDALEPALESARRLVDSGIEGALGIVVLPSSPADAPSSTSSICFEGQLKNYEGEPIVDSASFSYDRRVV